MLNLAALAALGFASARGTQLIVHDTIGDPLRDRIEVWHARKFESGVRTFIRTLLACLYCVGWHTSWIAVLAYELATDQWPGFLVFGIESFAVAGVQMIINRYDDTLPGGTN